MFVNDLNLVEDFLVDESVGLGLELDRGSTSTSPFIQRIAILGVVRISNG
jgi:hypothetical protein